MRIKVDPIAEQIPNYFDAYLFEKPNDYLTTEMKNIIDNTKIRMIAAIISAAGLSLLNLNSNSFLIF